MEANFQDLTNSPTSWPYVSLIMGTGLCLGVTESINPTFSNQPLFKKKKDLWVVPNKWLNIPGTAAPTDTATWVEYRM